MAKEYERWMSWFGKKHGQYKIEKGDFLCEEVKEKINNATWVCVVITVKCNKATQWHLIDNYIWYYCVLLYQQEFDIIDKIACCANCTDGLIFYLSENSREFPWSFRDRRQLFLWGDSANSRWTINRSVIKVRDSGWSTNWGKVRNPFEEKCLKICCHGNGMPWTSVSNFSPLFPKSRNGVC